jgi:ankyrin repeat protein
MRHSLAVSALAAATAFAGLLAAQTPPKVDFRRDIQPLFQEKCIGCHGPSQQSAGMRLDRRSSAMQARGFVRLGQGNSAGSMVYLRISGTRYGIRMPPTGPLDPGQIELIRNWIDQGAEWPDDLAGEKALASPDPGAVWLMESLRSGNAQAFARLLRENQEVVNRKGLGGTTPLMYAALYADTGSLRQLIERGADPKIANDAGATALMWAIDDVEKTRLLLEHGADPNATSLDGRTAMDIALGNRGSSAIVKLLFELSAKEPKSFAGAGGNEALLRMLIAQGIDPARLSAGLTSALAAKCSACVAMLIKSASKATLNNGLLGAAISGDESAMKLLLDHGADAKFARGGFTLLMEAAGSEKGHPDTVKSLIEQGADVNVQTSDGATALDFSLRQGRLAVPELLLKAGAKEGKTPPTPILKPKPAVSARAALDRSIPLIQLTDVIFLRKAGCVSCHNNNLTAMTVAAARKQGLPVDEGAAQGQRRGIAAYAETNRERNLQGLGIAGGSDTAGYILLGLAAESWPADPATDAMARYLKGRQNADGAWPALAGRPPLEGSQIQSTGTAMRALQVYAPRPQRAEYDNAVQRAADWLAQAQPTTNEDRSFQILGLVWAGGKQEIARKAGGDLLREQRADGGWAQLPTLASDAYATGQALVALKEAGVLKPSDPAYKRGAQFLMNTQMEDGSWYVRSRSPNPFQPYFESGFPFGQSIYFGCGHQLDRNGAGAPRALKLANRARIGDRAEGRDEDSVWGEVHEGRVPSATSPGGGYIQLPRSNRGSLSEFLGLLHSPLNMVPQRSQGIPRSHVALPAR